MMVAVTITGPLGQGIVQVCSGEKWTEAQDGVFVCMCVCMCLCVYICVHVCSRMHVNKYTPMSVRVGHL